MPITRHSPPTASRDAVAQRRASRVRRAPAPGPLEANAAADDLMAHPAFVMTASDAAAGASPHSAARHIGWRYITPSELGPGVTMVLEDQLTATHQFSTLDAGPYASDA